MNTFVSYFRIAALAVCAFVFTFAAQAQTSALTYQGQLNDGAAVANGVFQMQFTLFDAAANGNQIGATITNPNVTVAKGIFTVQLDFSPATPFAAGAPRFLQIAVKKAAETNYTALDPRQPITSAPYAVRTLSADTAATADNLSANCVACVTNNQIAAVDGSKVTGGAAITNLNASNLTAGTVPIARLGTNTPTATTFLRGDNTFATIPGGGGAGLELVATKNTPQNISFAPGSSSTTPSADVVTFQNTSGTLTGGNTFANNTFTVGATGAGLYLVTVQLVNDSFAVFPMLELNGAGVRDQNNYYGIGAGSTQFGNNPPSTPALRNFRGNLTAIIPMVAGNFFQVRAQNTSTNSSSALAGDNSTRLTVVKLN